MIITTIVVIITIVIVIKTVKSGVGAAGGHTQ